MFVCLEYEGKVMSLHGEASRIGKCFLFPPKKSDTDKKNGKAIPIPPPLAAILNGQQFVSQQLYWAKILSGNIIYI